MQTKISVRHGHLGQSIQQRITEKVDKLSRYFDRLTASDVTVNLEHEERPEIEIRVSIEHSEPLIATDCGSDVLTAFDGALHKIEQRIRKHKEKRTERRKEPLKHREVSVDSEPEPE